jgi:RNA polymerase sigma factor (TIGR02999 family)
VRPKLSASEDYNRVVPSLVQHGAPATGVMEGSSAEARGVTRFLGRSELGDPRATDELFADVYDELRQLADRLLANERPGQTLQRTALVHEAYLRLAGPPNATWDSRAHFFGSAARAIRRILIDRARARHRLRSEGGGGAMPMDAAAKVVAEEPGLDVLELDEALLHLARLDPQKARVVELRFFGGLGVDETAAALGTSPSTVVREWRFARIWLHRELSGNGRGERSRRR